MRKTLLNLELQDRTLQRRLIEPPPSSSFKKGNCSINDHEKVRMEKVKLYFPSAFGGRKFSGKKNSEIGIMDLLNDANNAQAVLKLTEMEFLQFLTKSMSGEAHTTMINYLDLYRRKQMKLEDIYLSLTDLYFQEMRPAAALSKLQTLSDTNHHYNSLSEAHNNILYLANLASLASRSTARQDALRADYYQQALLKIMPKDYRVLAISAFEQCGNLKRADLSPHEMLSCLNKMRQPIDDALRRISSRSDRGQNPRQSATVRRQVKRIAPQPPVSAPSAPHPPQEKTERKQKQRAPQPPIKKEVKAVSGPKRNTNPRSQNSRNKTPAQPSRNPLCKLCGSDGHPSDNCELYPVNQRIVGRYPCRQCNGTLYHYTKFCHKNRQAQKN